MCRGIGVGLGKVGKFLAQMGAATSAVLPKSGMGVSPVVSNRPRGPKQYGGWLTCWMLD